MISALVVGSALTEGNSVFFYVFFFPTSCSVDDIHYRTKCVWSMIPALPHYCRITCASIGEGGFNHSAHTSNSQNDVIIPFFSLHDTSHAFSRSTKTFTGIFSSSRPLSDTHAHLQRETEGHSVTKEEHFVPLTWSPLPTVDEGPQSPGSE